MKERHGDRRGYADVIAAPTLTLRAAARFEDLVVALSEKAGFELTRAKGKVRCRGLQLAA